jgi:hypothetical protein
MNSSEINNESKNIIATTKDIQLLSDWLVQGFADHRFDFSDLERDYDQTRTFMRLYNDILDPNEKNQIKLATVKALSEWNPEQYDNKILADLAFIACYTLNSDAVPALISLVEQNKFQQISDAETLDIKSTITAVIAGFAPDENIQITFQKWMDDINFDWRLKGIILNGLSTCNLENSTTYLRKFIQIVQEHPQYFSMNYIMSNFEDAIGEENYVNVIDTLKPAEKLVLKIN